MPTQDLDAEGENLYNLAMTQTILASLFAGYLAVSPLLPLSVEPRGRRPMYKGATREDILLKTPAAFPTSKQVLLLDAPIEPLYVYIRIDNVVYPLSVAANHGRC